ncbi:F-box domain-containing protein [Favolaschia claudopus]|uniref:F-box domain-containing protein n=1 Tax=Favolaschia claudopus TaxID=2862362 RepID=A0AAW0CBD5_9AGAR
MLVNLQCDRRRISDIESHISELQRTVAALEDEKAVLCDRLNAYKYPVLTLPNEITSEIFLHFIPPYPECSPLVGPYSPMQLMRICRKWRAVALATPSLWRTIGFTYIDSPLLHPADKGLDGLIGAWIERSGSCPLSVNISHSWPLLRPAHAARAISAVIPSYARWEHLQLCLDGESLPEIQGSMPQLRSIDLDVSTVPDSMLFRLCDMPQLRTASLSHPAALRVALPWSQLTTLKLLQIPPPYCPRILRQTVCLVHCDLLFANDKGTIYTGPDINLPHLQSLSLKPFYAMFVRGFHSALVVPALRQLEIPERFLGENPPDSLRSFISKSACKLTQLRITFREVRHQRPVVADALYRAACPTALDFSSGLGSGHESEDCESEFGSEPDYDSY